MLKKIVNMHSSLMQYRIVLNSHVSSICHGIHATFKAHACVLMTVSQIQNIVTHVIAVCGMRIMNQHTWSLIESILKLDGNTVRHGKRLIIECDLSHALNFFAIMVLMIIFIFKALKASRHRK